MLNAKISKLSFITFIYFVNFYWFYYVFIGFLWSRNRFWKREGNLAKHRAEARHVVVFLIIIILVKLYIYIALHVTRHYICVIKTSTYRVTSVALNSVTLLRGYLNCSESVGAQGNSHARRDVLAGWLILSLVPPLSGRLRYASSNSYCLGFVRS